MRAATKSPLFFSISLILPLLAPINPCCADAISPSVNGDGQVYSKEAPNASFYGTGMSGRMNEASALRFEGEQDTASQKYDVAIRKLAKAVQLDPSDPTGHVLFARALSQKIVTSKTAISPDMVNQAIQEWKMIWHHDADIMEQMEGQREVRRLKKIAKAVEKQQQLQSDLVAQKDQQSR